MRKSLNENSDDKMLSTGNSFAYLDLLNDNAPKVFSEYAAEAQILKNQVDNPSVCNIAVVAKYGAGKSSVINTYLYNHRRTEKEKGKNINVGRPDKNTT